MTVILPGGLSPRLLSLHEVMDLIGVNKLHRMGITGRGVRVAVLDTGATHPFFKKNVISRFSVVENEPRGTRGSHGSAMAGIIAGRRMLTHYDGRVYNSVGAAPDAKLILVRCVNDRAEMVVTECMKAIELAIDEGADIISMSIGSQHPTEIGTLIDEYMDRAVLFVVAAGSGGPGPMTIECPGVTRGAITVGSVTSGFRVSKESSRGPTADGRIKPDIMSIGGEDAVGLPEEYIVSSGLGREWIRSGSTSAATASVAGVLALLVQAGMPIDRGIAKEVLSAGAIQIIGPPGTKNNDSGWGVVNAHRSYQYLVERFK